MSELPQFRHYPGAEADGLFAQSEEVCDACERARGWIADCVVYTALADEVFVCPWCIADGTAATRFEGTFNEVEATVPEDLRAIVEQRTPGIESWQDWDWPGHCGEPAIYLGQPRAGQMPPEAVAFLRAQGMAQDLIDTLDPEASATGYLFQCARCSQLLVRWDAD